MLDNIKNVFANRKFQLGIALAAVFGIVFSGFYLSDDDSTITTENAATISLEVDATEHNQTPTMSEKDKATDEVQVTNSDVNANTPNETVESEEK